MFNRRPSKRFVLGESSELNPTWEAGENVIPTINLERRASLDRYGSDERRGSQAERRLSLADRYEDRRGSLAERFDGLVERFDEGRPMVERIDERRSSIVERIEERRASLAERRPSLAERFDDRTSLYNSDARRDSVDRYDDPMRRASLEFYCGGIEMKTPARRKNSGSEALRHSNLLRPPQATLT